MADIRSTRADASRRANRARKQIEQTVIIDSLTAAQWKRRAKLEADPEAWIWTMCGPKSGIRVPLDKKFTSQQAVMIGAYADTLADGGDELMLASRGEGKTTYLRAMIWKTVSEGSAKFVAYIGATDADATNSLRAIQDMVARSKPYAVLYPEIATPCVRVGKVPQLANTMRATGRDNEGNQYFQHPVSFLWSNEGLDFPDVPGSVSAGAMLRFRGADSPIRGLNIYGQRPDIVAMDDLDYQDSVLNPDVAKKVIDRVDLDIGGLGTPTQPLSRLMLATLPYQGCGVAYHYASTGYPFVVKRFKYLLEKPIRWDLWMEYVKLRQKCKVAGDKHGRKAHKFFLRNRADMEAGAVVSNTWRFNPRKLPDRTRTQVSALQNYFDEWADKGEMFCRCELDNEIVETERIIQSTLELGHVSDCESELPRGIVLPSTSLITRGVDVRKPELHTAMIATDGSCHNRVPLYDVRNHATSEITVEQAEHAILKGLNALADEWDSSPAVDERGHRYECDLTLIDKGWLGNWKEDDEEKKWATQPVETFCMQRGLHRFIPAKGQPNYRSPAPSRHVIIGDNWHINLGKGQERICDEVIWDAFFWHTLVEGLFMLPENDIDKLSLFVATNEGEGVWNNHSRLATHIREGSQEMWLQKRKGTKTRKPRYRTDHWWDAFAMALVAKSVAVLLRERAAKKKQKQSLSQMQKAARK